MHRSLPREHCLAQFHARKRCALDPRTRAHTGLGTEVISPFLIFSRDNGRFCSTIWHRVHARDLRFEKKGCRTASPQRAIHEGAIDLRSYLRLLHTYRNFDSDFASISDIPFPLYSLSLPDTSILHVFFPPSRHLLIVIYVYVYLSNRDLPLSCNEMK